MLTIIMYIYLLELPSRIDTSYVTVNEEDNLIYNVYLKIYVS